jgi:hypothetical protein
VACGKKPACGKEAGGVQHSPGGELLADGNYFSKHDDLVKKKKF